jgi:hypothetical protein
MLDSECRCPQSGTALVLGQFAQVEAFVDFAYSTWRSTNKLTRERKVTIITDQSYFKLSSTSTVRRPASFFAQAGLQWTTNLMKLQNSNV